MALEEGRGLVRAQGVRLLRGGEYVCETCPVHWTGSLSQQARHSALHHTHDAMELIDVVVPLGRNTAKTSAGKINKYEAVAELPKEAWGQWKRQGRTPPSRSWPVGWGCFQYISKTPWGNKGPVLLCPHPAGVIFLQTLAWSLGDV